MTGAGILVVCTGNIARSPMAQRLLQTYLSDVAEVTVSSAGTWGHEGAAMEPYAALCLAEVGVDEGGFRARELTAAMVREAALVLTAAREHRTAVLAQEPAALRRTFTLREMARLLPHVGWESLHGTSGPARVVRLAAAAAAARGSARAAPSEDDIADPYGGPLVAYRACRDQIDAAARAVADAVRAT